MLVATAAIYGDGEHRHFLRILSHATFGLMAVSVGPADALQDWVYVENLAEAHVLAGEKLIEESALGYARSPTRNAQAVGGRAFFISDGVPVNTFSFLGQFADGLGLQGPIRWLRVPTALMYGTGWICETVVAVFATIGVRLPLPVSRGEVNKGTAFPTAPHSAHR
jgi:hypothetical protein